VLRGLAGGAPPGDRPLCIIDRSAAVVQAEADLCCALFASVGGARPLISADQVRQAIAHSFNIALETMVVAATEPEDFIVFFPGVATANRVFNGGAPFQAPGFPLFSRRWTKVTHTESAVLLSFVQVELRGIPTHVWWRSTAQQLLGGGCWVQELHADTAARQHPSSECEASTRASVHARLGPLDRHVEAANSRSAGRAPLAFNAVPPKAAASDDLPASPVP
jgi:hypothetical protein